MSNNFFVYGTLMRGCSNHHVIPDESIENIKPAYIKGMDLYMYKGANFPCMVEGSNTIVGEIITIKDEYLPLALKMMDRLEGYHGPNEFNFYNRELKNVQTFNGTIVQCYVYLFNLESSNSLGEEITGGDFRSHINNELGGNL